MADNTMKDALSALIDGELDEREMQALIREMRDDAEHKQCWERYHIIGDALRNNLPSEINCSLADRVSKSILNEDLPLQEQPKPTHSRSTRPWAGFAMAASVATVAYLGFGMMGLDDQAGPRLASNNTPASMASPVVPNMVAQSKVRPLDFQTVSGGSRSLSQASLQSRLNPYLNDHRNVANSTGMTVWVLPRAKVVTAEPVQNKDK